ncbi:MAG: hypothetical protein B7Y41_01685 [Hydrogenophilales bacterium 28-61-23]|nr:MAG: hypothetical protein B7Y41_01685 [Hydrogenophilales bacterium 28-61-23]
MNSPRRSLLRLALLSSLAWMVGCDEEKRAQEPQYLHQSPSQGERVVRFGVHPLHNPQKLHRVFAPLMAYLERRIPGTRFELEASNNYAHYEQKLKARRFEFALPNPYQTMLARDWGYRVIAKLDDDQDFRGIFLVRADSGISQPADLRGKAVSYPAPTALAAAMMPQLYLQKHGLDVNRDIENHYVGSQESSIMSVYLSRSAAGATWPPPWRTFQKNHAKEAAALRVAWETPPLINNAFVARRDLPEGLTNQVRLALLGLGESADGKAILADMESRGIVAAEDRDYAVVEHFMAEFVARVRPL